jgi:hypothetical protein
MDSVYALDNELVARRGRLYAQLWGREPDFVCHQTDAEVPHIDVYRFPPTHEESCPVSFRNVYITAGMSDVPMSVPDRLADSIPSRIEISAYSDEVIMMENGKADFICTILHWMAHHPFRQSTFFASSQTFQVGRPIIPQSEMTAYYFAQTPIVDAGKLFDHTPKAEGFVHLVPISEAERRLAVEAGSKKLLELFHNHGVNPDFDLKRKSLL